MPPTDDRDPTPTPDPTPWVPDPLGDPPDDLLPYIELELDPPPVLPVPALLGGQTIDHARLRGRGWYGPVVTAQAGDECIVIRCDDAHAPANWIELTLSAETVAELLARIIAMRANVEQASLDCLRAMSEHLPR